MNILEFAGAHPWVAVLSIMVLAHMPVAIIRELRRAPFKSRTRNTDGN